ncbi:hypothetical protein F5148DRAFT_1279105 [Russula earlei]|uniref:Uncharacterized protein n=1 Tax=Russula earlei TaxID=71964 RepID=A0ACC0UN01_9AGAM|nr:hypothetical protein F5148DRAFT_1279105 [Russula earlei]
MSTRKLAITFLFSLALLLALTAPSSSTLISPASVHHRDHANLNRMIKIRAASPAVPRQLVNSIPPINVPPLSTSTAAAAAPTSTSDTPSAAPQSSSPVAAPRSSSTPAPAPAPSPAPPSASGSQIPSPSASSTLLQSPVAPTSSSTPAAGTTPTTTAVAPVATTPSASSPGSPGSPSISNAPASSTVKSVSLTVVNGKTISVDSITVTSHVPAASSTTVTPAQLGASSLSHTTIKIIIALAASVGGCAIIWTIIRKWKFRPSDKFEDRLEPVNWQPTEHDSSLPTVRRMISNASSFHSAGHDNIMGLGRSNTTYNANRGLTPLPEHDFTAGPATLAPVGGYADLARGPSPQPQMQETDALQRGPSFNRGEDNYYQAPPPVYGMPNGYEHNY